MVVSRLLVSTGVVPNTIKYYTRCVAEKAVETFIDPRTAKANVTSLVVAGSHIGQLVFNELDPRLAVLCSRVEVAYGGELGLRQAVSRVDHIGDAAKQELLILERFFLTLRTKPELIACGLKETMYALQAGVVEQLLVHDESTAIVPDVESDEPLTVLDFLLCDPENLQGAALQLVHGFDNNGSMFIKSFEGVSAILRYPFDCSAVHARSDEDGDAHSDDDLMEELLAQVPVKRGRGGGAASSIDPNDDPEF